MNHFLFVNHLLSYRLAITQGSKVGSNCLSIGSKVGSEGCNTFVIIERWERVCEREGGDFRQRL